MRKILGTAIIVLIIVFAGQAWGDGTPPLNTCDLSYTTSPTSCTIAAATGSLTLGSSATFTKVPDWQPTGTGYIEPFLRIGSNNTYEAGYNADFDTGKHAVYPIQLDAEVGGSPNWTHSVPISSLAIQTIGGVNYITFRLDINQEGGHPYLTLQQFRVYASDVANPTLPASFPDGKHHTWPDPASATQGQTAFLGALVYDMGGPAPGNSIFLNYNCAHGSNCTNSGGGSGNGDLYVLVPWFDIPTTATNMILFSYFNNENNDGYEEWTTDQTAPPVPEPASLILLGSGLLGVVSLTRRKK